MCDDCRVEEAINEAGLAWESARAIKARPSKEDPPNTVEQYWLFRSQTVEYLLDALDAIGITIQGRPTPGELQDRLQYLARDIRLVISLLPRGAGGEIFPRKPEEE